MIYVPSKLKVADNSGVQLVECIKVLKGSRVGHIGDMLVVTAQKLSLNSKFKKGQIFKAILVRSKKGFVRPNGMHFTFEDNAVILLNAQFQLIGNRIIGPIPRELRHLHQLKILSLAKDIV